MSENTRVVESSGAYESKAIERENRQTIDVRQTSEQTWQITWVSSTGRRVVSVSKVAAARALARKEQHLADAEPGTERHARFAYEVADLQWKLEQLEAHGA